MFVDCFGLLATRPVARRQSEGLQHSWKVLELNHHLFVISIQTVHEYADLGARVTVSPATVHISKYLSSLWNTVLKR